MAPSEEPDPDNDHTPPVKRRRVAVACDACRTRKSRCDGTQPQCLQCRDFGFECVYTPLRTTTNVIAKKDYLHGLEDRVKKLEDTLLNVRDDLDGLAARVDRTGPVARRGEDASHSVVPPDATGAEPSGRAMALADEEDSGFFGPSSHVAFLRHLSEALPRQENMPLHGAVEGGVVSASRAPSAPGRVSGPDHRPQVDIFALPSKSETLELIQRYFSNAGLLLPYIYPPVFLDTYHQMARENFTKGRRTWLGLLNMVLAMSSITAVPGGAKADTRAVGSDVFYQRAMGLCGSEMLRGTSLEVVQFLLLTTQYLHGTQKSVQAWTVHGLAVKAALQLGLHSRIASRTFSPLEQETRKRTWYGCVVLDRTLSMMLGRPPAIPESYVKLELPSKQGVEKSSAFAYGETSIRSLCFFNSTITLYKQLWNVLDLLYGQNIACDAPPSVSETVAHIFSLEQQLFAWERSLEQPLQLISTTDLDQIPKERPSNYQYYTWKFRIILTLRYLNLRMLLHRPVLVKFIIAGRSGEYDSQEAKLLDQIGKNSMQICRETAMAIIDIVDWVVSKPDWKQSLLGAWWFSLYYTFNAALVILGAVNSSTVTAHATRIREYPGRAVIALSKLDKGNRLVDRCRYCLEQLNEIIVGPDYLDELASASPSVGNAPNPLSACGLGSASFEMEAGEFIMDSDLVALRDWQLENAG